MVSLLFGFFISRGGRTLTMTRPRSKMDNRNHPIVQTHLAEPQASAIPEDVIEEARLRRMSDEEAQEFGFRSMASKAGLFFWNSRSSVLKGALDAL